MYTASLMRQIQNAKPFHGNWEKGGRSDQVEISLLVHLEQTED